MTAATALLLLLPIVTGAGALHSAAPASHLASPIGATGSAAPTAAQATTAAVLGSNLVANPGAEDGPISATGFEVVAIPSWTRVGNVTVVRYATNPGFWPALSQAGPVARGAASFSGGPLAILDSLSQNIDLSALAATVDSGMVRFDLAAYLGGMGASNDHVAVQARFLNASNALLNTATIGPVMASDRANVTGLLLRSVSGALPIGARTAAVTMAFTGSSGFYVLGFADSVGLSLSPMAVTAVGGPGSSSGLKLLMTPNPAFAEALIAFALPVSGTARVEVLDVTGRRVALLLDGVRPAGQYEVRWSARQSGAGPGIYFVRFATSSGSVVRKLVTLSR